MADAPGPYLYNPRRFLVHDWIQKPEPDDGCELPGAGTSATSIRGEKSRPVGANQSDVRRFADDAGM